VYLPTFGITEDALLWLYLIQQNVLDFLEMEHQLRRMKIQNFVMKLKDRDGGVLSPSAHDRRRDSGEVGADRSRQGESNGLSARGAKSSTGAKKNTIIGASATPNKRGVVSGEGRGRKSGGRGHGASVDRRMVGGREVSELSPPPSPLARAPVPHQHRNNPTADSLSNADRSNGRDLSSGGGSAGKRAVASGAVPSPAGFETDSGSDTEGEQEGEAPPSYSDWGEDDDRGSSAQGPSTPSRKLQTSPLRSPARPRSGSGMGSVQSSVPAGVRRNSSSGSRSRSNSHSNGGSGRRNTVQSAAEERLSRRDKLQEMREAAAARVRAKKQEDEEVRR
jgi:hypothetical protein